MGENLKMKSLTVKLLEESVDLGNNNIIAITGRPNSGKTFTGFKFLDLFNQVDIDRVHFDVDKFKEYLLFLASGASLDFSGVSIDLNWHIVEETGILADKRKWYSEQNMILNYVAQGGRFVKVNLILTMPHLGLIDPVLRSLINLWIDLEERQRGTVYKIGCHRWSGKIFYKELEKIEISDFDEEENKEFLELYYQKKKDFWIGMLRGSMDKYRFNNLVYHLYKLEGYSQPEIARMAGCAVSTINTIIKRREEKEKLLSNARSLVPQSY